MSQPASADDLAEELLELKQPKKRFRGPDGMPLNSQDHLDTLACTFEGCQKEFTSQQQLKTHLAYHQSKANFFCSVPSCRKPFNYRHNL